jgi:HD superfamily phosphohydrolase YqeK
VTLHPIVRDAATGALPSWAVAGSERRAHMGRVADLLGAWAEALGVDEEERVRWRAAGFLHDALRDEDPEVLRDRVPPGERHLADGVLHGPAVAERLRIDGVEDGPFLTAVAWHTLGDARFGRLGRALYAADFLEPGRPYRVEERASMRARMPGALDEVTRAVARARLGRRIEKDGALPLRSVAFWNRLVEDAG